MVDKRMVCWPAEWIEAAIKSGLAERTEDGMRMNHLTGDHLRDAVGEFATQIVEPALDAAYDEEPKR